MSTTVTLDGAGRVIIPKPLRDELGLSPGDSLSLESDGEGVTLRPLRSASAMRREKGVWVFRSGHSISSSETEKALAELRRMRDRSAHGA